LRIGRFDYDNALAFNDSGFYLLLLGGFQIAFILGFLAHPLNGIHDVTLLRQKSVAEIRGPLNVISQQLYHLWQRSKSLNACIPRLLRHGIGKFFVFQILVFVQPLLEQDDFERIRGRGKDLSEQRVGIEGERCYQRIQLLGRDLDRLSRFCRRRRLMRHIRHCVARYESDGT
jgi:hypothetical protein